MATSAPSATSTARTQRTWPLLEIAIGATALVLGLAVWAYVSLSKAPDKAKPLPVWMAVPKVTSQTDDGRMLNIKVNLRLAELEQVKALQGHADAFKAIVQDLGNEVTPDDMHNPDRITELGRQIKSTVNNYLRSQQVQARIKGVAFDELHLLP